MDLLTVILAVFVLSVGYLFLTKAPGKEQDPAEFIELKFKELNEKVDQILDYNVRTCRNCIHLRLDEIEIAAAINGASKCHYYCAQYRRPLKFIAGGDSLAADIRLPECMRNKGFEHASFSQNNKEKS